MVTQSHEDGEGELLRRIRAIDRDVPIGVALDMHPSLAWGNRPMLPHVMCQASDGEPNRALQQRCIAMEAAGALCASVFVGFPHADIENAGLSAVVVTDGDRSG